MTLPWEETTTVGTDVAAVEATTLVNPATGEMLPATPENAVVLLGELRRIRDAVQAAIRGCEEIVVEESTRQGARTLTLGGHKVEVSAGNKVVWNETVLHQLLDLGLPKDRFDALMRPTISYSVDTFEANRIAKANPDYAKVIKEARTDVPDRKRVSVKS